MQKNMIRARLIKAKKNVTRGLDPNWESVGEAQDRKEATEIIETPKASAARVKEIVSGWARNKGNNRQTDARAIFASLFTPVSD